MSRNRADGRSVKQWTAIASFALFGVAMLPPGLWLVNEPTLIGGYPVVYLWAIGWGAFGCAVLLWAAREDLFGISEEHVPPELSEEEPGATASDAPVEEPVVEGGDT